MDVMPHSDDRGKIDSGHTPLALRLAVWSGFAAAAANLGISYVLRGHACHAQSVRVQHVTTAICLLVTLIGEALALWILHELPEEKDDEGGAPHDRVHFPPLLAMGFNAGFAVMIIAVSIPTWMVQPC